MMMLDHEVLECVLESQKVKVGKTEHLSPPAYLISARDILAL